MCVKTRDTAALCHLQLSFLLTEYGRTVLFDPSPLFKTVQGNEEQERILRNHEYAVEQGLKRRRVTPCLSRVPAPSVVFYQTCRNFQTFCMALRDELLDNEVFARRMKVVSRMQAPSELYAEQPERQVAKYLINGKHLVLLSSSLHSEETYGTNISQAGPTGSKGHRIIAKCKEDSNMYRRKKLQSWTKYSKAYQMLVKDLLFSSPGL